MRQENEPIIFHLINKLTGKPVSIFFFVAHRPKFIFISKLTSNVMLSDDTE